MFRIANSIARQFTWPVVLSRKTVGGACASSIGAMVVINSDGWIVTAGHMIDQCAALIDADVKAKAYEAKYDEIKNDAAITSQERTKRLQQLTRPKKDDTQRASAWWGKDGITVNEAIMMPDVDIAVARLSPFDPSWVSTYPTFKDPAKDFEPGVSLCKLGFPLHQIAPIWHQNPEGFELSEPLVFFPLDGIFTRTISLNVPPGTVPAPPLSSELHRDINPRFTRPERWPDFRYARYDLGHTSENKSLSAWI